MKVGIVGCGAIGGEVARAVPRIQGAEGAWVFDIDAAALDALDGLDGVHRCSSWQELAAACDVVVEAANADVVRTIGPAVLERGGHFIVLTVGALADDALRDRLVALATEHGGKIHVPSGAIMGLDGLRGAREAGLKAVTLVTTKPPKALGKDVDQWTILFNGPAREAVTEYPKNVNVAATLSLAGLGLDETWVQIVADPLATRNSHKIIFEGAFGRARIEVENLSSPSNPKTSYLAALSTIALVRRLGSPIEVGN